MPQLSPSLEQRILHGLACEWHAALDVLAPEIFPNLRLPLFRLSDMESRMGYWSSVKKEICISRHLVLNGSWNEIREVLLHEMAHQFAQQVLGLGSGDAPHGDLFKKACHLLRANPRASGGHSDRSTKPCPQAINPEIRAVRRIHKLMALAESKNTNEAEAAMAKAHELMTKHQINSLEQPENRVYISTFVDKPALRHPRHAYFLANLLLDFYYVAGIWVPAYVLDKGKMGRVLEISGLPHNVEIAAYIHDFVKSFIHKQWLQYDKKKKLSRHRKTDFAVGIIEGFRSKLKSQHDSRQTDNRPNALVKAADPQLKAYMTYKHPYTSRFTRGGSYQDDSIIEDGLRIGKKMVISKAIAKRELGDRKLLGYSNQTDTAKNN